MRIEAYREALLSVMNTLAQCTQGPVLVTADVARVLEDAEAEGYVFPAWLIHHSLNDIPIKPEGAYPRPLMTTGDYPHPGRTLKP